MPNGARTTNNIRLPEQLEKKISELTISARKTLTARLLSDPFLREEVTKVLSELATRFSYDYIVSVDGIGLGFATVLSRVTNKHMFVVRRTEPFLPVVNMSAKSVLIVDDTMRTGATLIRASATVVDKHGKVEAALVVEDRDDSPMDRPTFTFPVLSVFRLSDYTGPVTDRKKRGLTSLDDYV